MEILQAFNAFIEGMANGIIVAAAILFLIKWRLS